MAFREKTEKLCLIREVITSNETGDKDKRMHINLCE